LTGTGGVQGQEQASLTSFLLQGKSHTAARFAAAAERPVAPTLTPLRRPARQQIGTDADDSTEERRTRTEHKRKDGRNRRHEPNNAAVHPKQHSKLLRRKAMG